MRDLDAVETADDVARRLAPGDGDRMGRDRDPSLCVHRGNHALDRQPPVHERIDADGDQVKRRRGHFLPRQHDRRGRPTRPTRLFDVEVQREPVVVRRHRDHVEPAACGFAPQRAGGQGAVAGERVHVEVRGEYTGRRRWRTCPPIQP